MPATNYLTKTFESNYKKLGIYTFNQDDLGVINGDKFRASIKILFVPKGYSLSVDFNQYTLGNDSLFFISPNQYLHINKASSKDAFLIFYNRDFYCVQIHDKEVACDGLLFNNIFEVPKVDLQAGESILVKSQFQVIEQEIENQDSSSEEMIRIYLKQLIIQSTRLWKKQNLETESVQIQHDEQDFFRNFSRLVEIHFRSKHSVSDYADLLGLAPKTLSSKFKKMNLENPNEVIKNRIILEAKRLLIYTDMNVKEIAYNLGYDDPAYFNRFYTTKTGITPIAFKKGK